MKKIQEYNKHLKHTYQLLICHFQNWFMDINDVKYELDSSEYDGLDDEYFDLIRVSFPTRSNNYKKRDLLERKFFSKNITYLYDNSEGTFTYTFKIDNLLPHFENKLSLKCDLPDVIDVPVTYLNASGILLQKVIQIDTEELVMENNSNSWIHSNYRNIMNVDFTLDEEGKIDFVRSRNLIKVTIQHLRNKVLNDLINEL